MEQQSRAPVEVRQFMEWLRNKSTIKLKGGVLNGKRMDYFKGKSAVKALLSPAYAKMSTKQPAVYPKVTSSEEATALMNSYLPHGFFLRVERGASMIPATGGSSTSAQKPLKALTINPQQQFTPDDYFIWLIGPSPTRAVLGGILMVAIILAGVMFPLWPHSMRVGVWYLSIASLGVIGLFFLLAIFRLILYIITVIVAKPGLWLFPNLFADVGFVDSFIPLYAWDYPVKKTKKRKGGEGSSKKSKKSKTGQDAPPADSKPQGATIEEIPDDE